jgi:UrcA family protein
MRLLSFSALLVLSSAATCVVAEPTEYATVVAKTAVRARTVSFADLNLQRHEGVATLYRRIRNAANLVCYESGVPPIQSQLSVRKCTSNAIGRAVAQVGVPALVALHAQNEKAAPVAMVARESR